MHRLIIAAVAVGCSLAGIAAAAEVPRVILDQSSQGSPVAANEGHLRLSWRVDGDATEADHPDLTFQLQRATDADFTNAPRWDVGPDRASYVSGLRDGDNYFRVRAITAAGEAGPWSESLWVQVAYPDRSQVLLLMAVGVVLLLATGMLILAGHRRWAAREG